MKKQESVGNDYFKFPRNALRKIKGYKFDTSFVFSLDIIFISFITLDDRFNEVIFHTKYMFLNMLSYILLTHPLVNSYKVQKIPFETDF